MNFWKKLEKPVVGLAPMDGVTDAAFRHMVCKHSKPSVVYTEFVNVEGLARGAMKMLPAFIYEEKERPIVGQIFGVEVESFYKAAVMLCAMGFDGVDINMGCPVNKVAKKGSGAGLIQTPDLAIEIIRAAKRGVADFANGVSLEEAGLHKNIIEACGGDFERREVPVSVKTRIGYNKDIAEEWIKILVEEDPDCICLHGRTLKQMYGGEASWDAIGRAGKIVKDAGIFFLGNGDVGSMEDALGKIEEYGVDGVLVGRAALGNPWFFGGPVPETKNRLDAVIEHCEYFEEVLGEVVPFHTIKKHLAWYCREFDGAREMRMKLMKAEKVQDVKNILQSF